MHTQAVLLSLSTQVGKKRLSSTLHHEQQCEKIYINFQSQNRFFKIRSCCNNIVTFSRSIGANGKKMNWSMVDKFRT
jgi:hypothetical protein